MISKAGREAVVAMLVPGQFFGEGTLAGQRHRTGSATASTGSTVLHIEKLQMIRLLHRQHTLSDRFITHMLARNIRIEEDLIDQLFNSSEKRPARALLLLARYRKQNAGADRDEDLTGDTGRHGGNHAVTRELFHEQVQEAGVHRLRGRSQRRTHQQQLTAQRRPPRLKPQPGPRPRRTETETAPEPSAAPVTAREAPPLLRRRLFASTVQAFLLCSDLHFMSGPRLGRLPFGDLPPGVRRHAFAGPGTTYLAPAFSGRATLNRPLMHLDTRRFRSWDVCIQSGNAPVLASAVARHRVLRIRLYLRALLS